jgi:hypothetical protein
MLGANQSMLGGVLSLRAVQLFNTNSNAKMLFLRPGGLPPKEHRQQKIVYR